MSQDLIAGNVAIAKPVAFKMPKVCLGMNVIWRPSPRGDPSAAIVVRVGDECIEVQCHVSGLNNHYTRGGVRHKDDPWLMTHPMAEQQGCWDYTVRDKAINAHIESFGGEE